MRPVSVPIARLALGLLACASSTLALAACGADDRPAASTRSAAPAARTATTDPRPAPYDSVEGAGSDTTTTDAAGPATSPGKGPCDLLPARGPVARLLVPGCRAAIDGADRVTAVAQEISGCKPTDFACGVRTIAAMRAPIDRLVRTDRALERAPDFRRLDGRCRSALLRPAEQRAVLRRARSGIDRVVRAHRRDDLTRLASAMQEFTASASDLAGAVAATIRPAAVEAGCGVDLG